MGTITITNRIYNLIRELLDSKGYTEPAIAIIIIEDDERYSIRDSDWMLIGFISKKENATIYD